MKRALLFISSLILIFNCFSQGNPTFVELEVNGVDDVSPGSTFNIEMESLTYFKIQVEFKNSGHDVPAGLGHITFSFPEFTSGSDKSYVEKYSSSTLEGTYIEKCAESTDAPDYYADYLMAECYNSTVWNGTEDYFANEDQTLKLKVYPQEYGIFRVYFRCALATQSNWSDVKRDPTSGQKDCLGYYAYYVDVNIIKPEPEPSITVTSPNGGENWVIGSTHSITWTSENVSGDVNIDINGNYPNGSWERLRTGTTNDGSWSWTVSGMEGTAKRIRVSSEDDSNVSDISNSNFTMTSPQADLTISSVSLSTTSIEAGGDVKVDFTAKNIGDGSSDYTIAGIYISTSQYGSETLLGEVDVTKLSSGVSEPYARTVTIPSGTSAGSYYITVYADKNDSEDEEEEGNNVNSESITVTGVPKITVTSPNGGENWEIGSTHSITWTSENVSGDVNIDINGNYPDGSWERLRTGTTNDGSWSWTVSGMEGTAKRIRVSSEDDSNVSDISNSNFTMTSPQADLTISSVSLSTTSIEAGGDVKVDFTAKNIGDGSSDYTIAGIYISSSQYGSETLLGEVDVTKLNSGSSEPYARTVTIPSGTSAGSYYITVYADKNDSEDEEEEGNNVNSESITVTGVPKITVTSPNGGENWEIGSTHSITWTSENVSGDVNIDINGNYPDGSWERLRTGTTNDGSWSWTVSGMEGTAKRIRVSSEDDSNVSDISNSNFTMTSPQADLTISSVSLSTTSIEAGGDVKVDFTAKNIGDGSSDYTIAGIYISSSQYGSETLLGEVDVTKLNSGSSEPYARTVTIPSGTSAGSYYITVYADKNDSEDEEEEGNNVNSESITVTGVPKITVTSPNGGENWEIGSTHSITWTSENVSGDVNIDINGNYPDGSWERLRTGTTNDGSWSWTVSGMEGTAKRIRVSSEDDSNVSDISNSNFTMTSPQADLTISSVSLSTTSIEAGGDVKVDFTAKNIGDGSSDYTIAGIYISSSQYGSETLLGEVDVTKLNSGSSEPYARTVTIPSGTSAGSYYITVYADKNDSEDEEEEGNNVNSESITVTGVPKITVTSPNGGENWEIGSTHSITWTSENVSGDVNIDINGNYPDGSWERLRTGTTNNGSWSWTVSGIEGTAKRIRVSSEDDSSVFDISNSNFAISNNVENSITIISPSGDENCEPWNNLLIEWSYSGEFNSMDIQYTTDNGVTWIPLASPNISSKEYVWEKLPEVNSDECKVKLLAYTSDGYEIAVSNQFSITYQNQRTINFSGREWWVKNTYGGPGANYWSNSEENVWLDNEGMLHLKVIDEGDKWTCAEVISIDKMEYGTYTFKTIGNVENFDKNYVTGLYLYENDESEIDIEFSQWGDPNSKFGWYTVQPSTSNDFNLNLEPDNDSPYSTHRIIWTPDYIKFQSWYGHEDEPTSTTKISEWIYTGDDNPTPAEHKLQINLWLLESAAPTDGKEQELVIKEARYSNEIPKEINVALSLYKVTDTRGTLNTDQPGEDKYTFARGETVRLTFQLEYDITSDLSGLIAFEFYDQNGNSIFDSNPVDNVEVTLRKGTGTSYFSFDWLIPYYDSDMTFGVGAALREDNNFENVVDETYPGANTTEFKTGWIHESAFEVLLEVDDKTPPEIEVYRVWQDGDGKLKIIAKVTDANSGVHHINLNTRTLSTPLNIPSDLQPVPGYSGFFYGESLISFDYGDYVIWQLVARDNDWNWTEYPKDIGKYTVSSPNEIDDDFSEDWCLRMLIEDEESLKNNKLFHIANSPTSAITIEQEHDKISIFNNTTMWYEMSATPNVLNKGDGWIEELKYCLNPGRSGFIPIKELFYRPPSYTISGVQNLKELEFSFDKKSRAALVLNGFDMIRFAISSKYPQVAGNMDKWKTIVQNVITKKSDVIDIALEGIDLSKDPETLTFILLKKFLTKEVIELTAEQLYKEYFTDIATKETKEIITNNIGYAFSLLTGINNRVEFLIELFKYPDNQEKIELIKADALDFNYATFPSSIDNNNSLKIYSGESSSTVLYFNPTFDYKNIFKACAEVKIFNPSGELIDISKLNSDDLTGSFKTELAGSYSTGTQNGTFMKIAGSDNMGVVLRHEFDVDMNGDSYASTYQPYYMEIDLYEGGLPNEIAPNTSTLLISTGKVPFNIYDRIAPLQPELYEISTNNSDNQIGFSIRHKDQDISMYRIFRKLESETEFVEVNTLINHGGSISCYYDIFDDTQASVNYKFKAVDISGNESAYSDEYTIQTGATKILDVSPSSSCIFGTVTIGQSKSVSIVLTNSGNTAISVSNLSLTGTNSNNFEIVSPGASSFDIPAGSSQEVVIRFSPSSSEGITADLNIVNDSDNSPNKTITLSGTGTELTTKTLDVSPALSYDYSSVSLGESRSKTFVLSNSGNTELSVSDLFVSGTNSSNFEIVSPGTSSFDIPAGSSQEVVVRFTPSVAGGKTASLTITNDSDNSPNKTITLSGTGTELTTKTLDVSPALSYDYSSVSLGESRSKTFVLSNSDNTELSVSDLFVSGTNSSNFEIVSPGTRSFDIPAGSSQEVVVRFTPSVAGGKTASLTITNNSDNSPNKTITLSGTGTELPTKTLDVSPILSYDYGSVSLGESRSKTFVLSNSGNTELSVSDLFVSGTNSSNFEIVSPGTSSFDIPAGSSQEVVVRFTPSVAGGKTASLTITNNSDNSPNKTITLSGTGTELPTKTLDVSPILSYDYGSVSLGESRSKTFVLSNSGNTELSVSDLFVSGTNSSNFEIVSPGTSSFDIPAGSSQEVVVRFTPSVAGGKTASLTITNNSDNSPNKTITLSGTGTELTTKTLDVSPALSYDYSSVSLGESRSKTFVLSNSDNTELSVSDLFVSGTNSSNFEIVSPGTRSFDIPAGSSQEVVVRFTPSVAGGKTASLTITNNSDNSPNKTITLSGTGTELTTKTLDVSPALSYDYGSVSLGESRSKTFALSNSGNTELSVSDLFVSGTNSSNFEIVSPGTRSFDIPAGSSQEVVVRFTPSVAGGKTASLTITNNSDNSPIMIINLTGTGQQISTDEVTSLIITGPKMINENGFANFVCTAFYEDGSSKEVTTAVNWTVSNTSTFINNSGKLYSSEVDENIVLQVAASYSNKSTDCSVTILDIGKPYTSISNEYAKVVNDITIYPNPTSGIVTIESTSVNRSDIEVNVFSIDGSRIFNKSYHSSDKITFDLTDEVSGMYFVKIRTDEGEVVKKLILNKN